VIERLATNFDVEFEPVHVHAQINELPDMLRLMSLGFRV
jgi:hypothetical protein